MSQSFIVAPVKTQDGDVRSVTINLDRLILVGPVNKGKRTEILVSNGTSATGMVLEIAYDSFLAALRTMYADGQIAALKELTWVPIEDTKIISPDSKIVTMH